MCKQIGLRWKKKLKVDVWTRWNLIYFILKGCEMYEIGITKFFNTQSKEIENPIFFYWIWLGHP